MTGRQQRPGHFTVASLFGAATRAPLVTLSYPEKDFSVTIRVEEARALALNLLEGAESAEQDAGLVRHFSALGMDLREIAPILTAIRRQREEPRP